jgi:hypothetical protein
LRGWEGKCGVSRQIGPRASTHRITLVFTLSHSLPRTLHQAMEDTRDRIVFLDIDNTLYSASTQISVAMGERIHSTGLPATPVPDAQ